MAPADWRLISMWEGEPVGVDPRRPLLGFVLVAVLCAVLMTISVGRGFGVDLVHPGKPIATPPVRTPVEPPADVVVVPASVTLPDGLSADPYAAAVASGGPVPASASEESASESTATESTPDTTVDTEATTSSPKVERKADKAATKAERKADKAAAKAERKADKAAAKAARDAAKAARKG